MIKEVTKEKYVSNPCGSLATAYWKHIEYAVPKNMEIVHQQNYNACMQSNNVEKYFRLLHNLDEVVQLPRADFLIQTINIDNQKELVAQLLSECYHTDYSVAFIDGLTKTNVYDSDLWILAIEKETMTPVALGIADFDKDIKEGSLEWIQVLPNKRGMGLGTLIVNELLSRLKGKADFVTVSGQVDNVTNPERLYRKCGFIGNDVWYVIHNEYK